jgi:hypothetical protein
LFLGEFDSNKPLAGVARCRFRGVGRIAPLEQPHELRELAKWYRGWAEFGNARDRAWQAGFAEYLERRATEIETLLASAERRPAH